MRNDKLEMINDKLYMRMTNDKHDNMKRHKRNGESMKRKAGCG